MPTRKIKIGAKTVRLDARPDRLDLRDRPYAPPIASLPPCWPDDATLRKLLPSYIKQGLVLDQKTDGACTGYGLAATVNFLLWRGAKAKKISPASARTCCTTWRASMTNGRARITTAPAAVAR